ncbi:hypothetical protein L4C34_11785 [Vibrio profundum]|uniref:hypothetical protein n=1 Tax=Vibrio profundum TaxID=2910247 RepID=UPI003D0A5BC5
MSKVWIIIGVFVGMISNQVFASTSDPASSNTYNQTAPTIAERSGTASALADNFTLPTDSVPQMPSFDFSNSQDTTDNYWSDWAIKYKSEPFLSDSLSFSHFGVGVWQPQTAQRDPTFNTNLPTKPDQVGAIGSEEWLLNHGLQLSLGFGDQNSGQPRIRFDYLWHEDSYDNVMMQVEFPF